MSVIAKAFMKEDAPSYYDMIYPQKESPNTGIDKLIDKINKANGGI